MTDKTTEAVALTLCQMPASAPSYCAVLCEKCLNQAAAIRDHLKAEGYAIVPVEPSEGMIRAGFDVFTQHDPDGDLAWESAAEVFDAMLKAAEEE